MLKNKIWSIALLLIGVLVTIIADGDATALVFISLFAVPMFFAKEQWIF